MGDKVIRINSVQGFADSFTNTVPSTILNLCDFVVPKGLTMMLTMMRNLMFLIRH